MIKIDWLGHSAFNIKFPDLRVVIDPFSPEVGFSMKSVEADLVLVSHDHFDHNYIQGVKSDFTLINGPGEYEKNGVHINGWLTYHDGKQGQERGTNTIYQLLFDDYSLLHLGDLGHILADGIIESISRVDVLFIPIGGFYTLSIDRVIKVIEQLEPNYVIPMHYRTPEHSSRFKDLATLDVFLKEMGITESISPQPSLVLKAKDGDQTQVIILERQKSKK